MTSSFVGVFLVPMFLSIAASAAVDSPIDTDCEWYGCKPQYGYGPDIGAVPPPCYGGDLYDFVMVDATGDGYCVCEEENELRQCIESTPTCIMTVSMPLFRGGNATTHADSYCYTRRNFDGTTTGPTCTDWGFFVGPTESGDPLVASAAGCNTWSECKVTRSLAACVGTACPPAAECQLKLVAICRDCNFSCYTLTMPPID